MQPSKDSASEWSWVQSRFGQRLKQPVNTGNASIDAVEINRRAVDILYYLTVLFGLGILTISLAELMVIGWSQAVSSLWVVTVLGISFLLYHLLRRDFETERFGAAYAKKKQELENVEKMRSETKANLHAHHESVVNRMRGWKYWPRESGEMIYVVPEGVRPLFTTEPPNLEKDKNHLEEFPAVWKIYSDAPLACKRLREAEEAASRLITSRLQALNTNSILIAKRETDGSFRHLTKEIVQELDTELRSNRRQALVLRVEQKTGNKPHPVDYSSGISGDPVDTEQLAQLLAAIKQSEEVRELIENRLEAWDNVEANRNAFLRALSTNVIDPAENGNWEGLERGACDDCEPLKEKLLLLNRTEVSSG